LINIQETIEKIQADTRCFYGRGVQASYIPVLAQVDPHQFALTIVDSNKKIYSIGHDKAEFSIQSVSKVITLTMALNAVGDELWGRMEREPTGKSFDSLIHLEEYNGVPSNPFLNSGAIVLADILLEHYGSETIKKYLEFVRSATGNQAIEIDEKVYACEKATGYANYSFAYYMKSHGNIMNEVEEVLDIYFRFCSLRINNLDLAKCFYYLGHKGYSIDGDLLTSYRHCKRINSIMFTCGTYDEVGDFAYLVGLPVKSGVSGAIAGCLPNNYSVSVWSPELNPKGNSYLGFKALEQLTTMLDTSLMS
jgi:glutaminase